VSELSTLQVLGQRERKNPLHGRVLLESFDPSLKLGEMF
jgi:hypothetical protein